MSFYTRLLRNRAQTRGPIPTAADHLRTRVAEARTADERFIRLSALAMYLTRDAHRRAFVAGVSLAANDGAGFARESVGPAAW